MESTQYQQCGAVIIPNLGKLLENLECGPFYPVLFKDVNVTKKRKETMDSYSGLNFKAGYLHAVHTQSDAGSKSQKTEANAIGTSLG